MFVCLINSYFDKVQERECVEQSSHYAQDYHFVVFAQDILLSVGALSCRLEYINRDQNEADAVD
jgi:hypothetical protein